jgi:hypothetical protein
VSCFVSACFSFFIFLFIYFFVRLLFVGVDTMKLNKSRLRQLAQFGEVAVDPVVLKRKRATSEGSSRRAEEVPTRPPPREAVPLVKDVPPVVMVDVDPNPPADPSVATVNQSPHVAMDRANAAFTSKDMDDYAAAHTEDVHYLMVHSLMRVCFSALLLFPIFLVFLFLIFPYL